MMEFIVEFSGGGEWEHYSFTYYFKALSMDDLEYKIIECNGVLPSGDAFEYYDIQKAEDWKVKKLITL